MSDQTLNRFVASGPTSARTGFVPSPPTPASGPNPGYLWFDTSLNQLFSWNGSAWVSTTGGGITQLTGDATAGPGSGSQPLTLAASGATAGTYGDASHVPQLTVNAKGLITSASAVALVRTGAIVVVIDGGGAAITTGVKAFLSVPFACTLTGWTLLSSDAAATSGSIQIDLWKAAYASYPPTVANTITGSAKPLFSSANKATSTTLTGWTTSIAAGDVIGVNVDSAATVTKVTLALAIQA